MTDKPSAILAHMELGNVLVSIQEVTASISLERTSIFPQILTVNEVRWIFVGDGHSPVLT